MSEYGERAAEYAQAALEAAWVQGYIAADNGLSEETNPYAKDQP